MAWLRLDDGFANDPKIAALTDGELRVWLRVLCYCACHGRPIVDVLTRREVPGLSAKRLAQFVALGLIDELETGSYEIHDWRDFMPKDPTAIWRKQRQRARERR